MLGGLFFSPQRRGERKEFNLFFNKTFSITKHFRKSLTTFLSYTPS
jgi:hypothetical protein